MDRPQQYIRHIYNRCILEGAQVRAAAVAALGRFAWALRDSVSNDCLVLLRRFPIQLSINYPFNYPFHSIQFYPFNYQFHTLLMH